MVGHPQLGPVASGLNRCHDDATFGAVFDGVVEHIANDPRESHWVGINQDPGCPRPRSVLRQSGDGGSAATTCLTFCAKSTRSRSNAEPGTGGGPRQIVQLLDRGHRFRCL